MTLPSKSLHYQQLLLVMKSFKRRTVQHEVWIVNDRNAAWCAISREGVEDQMNHALHVIYLQPAPQLLLQHMSEMKADQTRTHTHPFLAAKSDQGCTSLHVSCTSPHTFSLGQSKQAAHMRLHNMQVQALGLREPLTTFQLPFSQHCFATLEVQAFERKA